jgi:cytochrome c-type biogenesis protein CcmH/NrfG
LALDPLERALDLASNEPRTQLRTQLRTRTSWARLHYRLGEVYRTLGRSEEARQHLERAVDLDWYGPIGDRARGTLSALQ